MIKRIFAIALVLQMSSFAHAGIDTSDQRDFLRMLLVLGASSSAEYLERFENKADADSKFIEKVAGLEVVSYARVRDLLQENEMAADARYQGPTLFFAKVDKVVLEGGYPVVYIDSLNIKKSGPLLRARLKKSNGLLAGSLRRSDNIVLLCDDLIADSDIAFTGCKLPGSFYSDWLDEGELREIFVKICQSTDESNPTNLISMALYILESPKAQEELKEVIFSASRKDSFLKFGNDIDDEMRLLLKPDVEKFLSDKSDEFNLNTSDIDREKLCQRLF